MKYILTFMILALCGTFASAQTDEKAKAILDKTVGQIKSYPAVEIVFDLSMINKEENIQETHPGKAYMKDNMYRIDVMDVINYFDGEVIYTNPFARYDASVAQTPYMAPAHTVNIPLTILFNFTLLVLCAGVILTFYKTVIKW